MLISIIKQFNMDRQDEQDVGLCQVIRLWAKPMVVFIRDHSLKCRILDKQATDFMPVACPVSQCSFVSRYFFRIFATPAMANNPSKALSPTRPATGTPSLTIRDAEALRVSVLESNTSTV